MKASGRFGLRGVRAREIWLMGSWVVARGSLAQPTELQLKLMMPRVDIRG